MAWLTYPTSKRGFLRIPPSPSFAGGGDEDEPFIESSQALEVNQFRRKLNLLVFTTGLLSVAVAALLVVVVIMLRDFQPQHSHAAAGGA